MKYYNKYLEAEMSLGERELTFEEALKEVLFSKDRKAAKKLFSKFVDFNFPKEEKNEKKSKTRSTNID